MKQITRRKGTEVTQCELDPTINEKWKIEAKVFSQIIDKTEYDRNFTEPVASKILPEKGFTWSSRIGCRLGRVLLIPSPARRRRLGGCSREWTERWRTNGLWLWLLLVGGIAAGNPTRQGGAWSSLSVIGLVMILLQYQVPCTFPNVIIFLTYDFVWGGVVAMIIGMQTENI